MASVELTDQEWQQVMNILATTKEHPWVVTNPLLMRIGGQVQAQAPQPIRSTPQPTTTERAWAADGKEASHE
jgi:hypothetical protein